MNELKYCKFCDKEKPIKDFVKSGFAVKNICRECQNQKQTQIYKNSKKVEELQQENKQLNNILTELEETIKNKIKGFKEDKDYFIDEKDMYELDNLIQKLKEKYK